MKLDYSDYEIIVIDDGSTDLTAAITQAYRRTHNRVRAVFLEYNQGKVLTVSGVISAFRKKALQEVGFWDTDMVTEDIDITWKPEKIFGMSVMSRARSAGLGCRKP